MGHSLAGDRDCSRRLEAEGAAVRSDWARSRGRTPPRRWLKNSRWLESRRRRGPASRSARWRTNWQAHVVPMYKHSTQKNHRHILTKHLVPRLWRPGDVRTDAKNIQEYVTHLMQREVRAEDHRSHPRRVERSAPHGREMGSPAGEPSARGRPARLRTVRPKWALTRRRRKRC